MKIIIMYDDKDKKANDLIIEANFHIFRVKVEK